MKIKNFKELMRFHCLFADEPKNPSNVKGKTSKKKRKDISTIPYTLAIVIFTISGKICYDNPRVVSGLATLTGIYLYVYSSQFDKS